MNLANFDTIKTRILPGCNYKAIWYKGKTIRIAIDPNKPIEELNYPEFYDVKITDYCKGKCPYCYMDSTEKGLHAENVLYKIDKFFGEMDTKHRPFQVAIGGGEPTTHPHFIEILEKFYSLGIQPNYTTNGMNISNDLLQKTKQYCGGVAVSCHPHLNRDWDSAVRWFAVFGIKLNLHIIISDKESINEFRKIYDNWKNVVDYFVLLPYGVQGRAEEKEIDWEYLVEMLPKSHKQIAFGANFHKYLLMDNHNIKVSLYEPESMSKFLDLNDMKLYPSSFNLKEVK